jgi:hypothetical protein
MDENKNKYDFAKNSQLGDLLGKMREEEEKKSKDQRTQRVQKKVDSDFEVLNIDEDLATGVSGSQAEPSDIKENIEDFKEFEQVLEEEFAESFHNFMERANIVSAR